MVWVWTPIALVGAIGGLLSCALAVFIYLARPQASQNRWLAAYFVMVGIWYLWGNGLRHMLGGPESMRFVTAMGLTAIFFVFPFMQWSYLLFLSTVGGPVGRFLARRPVRIVYGALFSAIAVSVIIRPDWYVVGLDPWHHLDSWQYDVGPMADILFRLQPVIHLIGIVVALTALREARSKELRHQLKLYALAFIAVDVSTAGWYTYLSVIINQPPFTATQEAIYVAWGAFNIFLLLILVGYGILKAQLFDVDIRIKAGVRRGIVLAPFAVAFFVLSESLEGALPFPGYWAGLVGAGLIALALAPIQRFATRLVDRMFPHVDESDAYIARRKTSVYVAALEGALKDGVITHKERDLLEGLRRSLGLSPSEVQALERSMQEHASIGRPI